MSAISGSVIRTRAVVLSFEVEYFKEGSFLYQELSLMWGEEVGGDHTDLFRTLAEFGRSPTSASAGTNRALPAETLEFFRNTENDVGGVRHSERDSDVQHTCARGEASSGGAPFAFGREF